MRDAKGAWVGWLVWGLVGCTTPTDEVTDDTESDETDVGDTDDSEVEDTDDTDVADTDDTDDTDVEPAGCTLTTFPPGTQLDGEPSGGEIVTIARTIEVCASATAWTGQWTTIVSAPSGDRYCTFQVQMQSTTTTESCEDCQHGFSGITYTDAVISDPDLCSLWALDAQFVAGLNGAYDAMGLASASDDILFDDDGGWERLDEDPSTVRTRTAFGDVTYLKLAFSYSFAWE